MQNKQNEIDNINELCNLYSLTDENFNEYYKKVMLFLTSNKKAGENKTLVIVGGQSGAGKSRLIKIALKELNNNAVIVDFDELRAAHPHYKEVCENYPEITHRILHPDTEKVKNAALKTLIEQEYNVIYEGALRNTQGFLDFASDFKKSGYNVEMFIMAVPKLESYGSTFLRYCTALITDSSARWVEKSAHDGSYEGVTRTVEEFIKQKMVDSISVFVRSNELPKKIYSTQERQHSDAVMAIKYGRELGRKKAVEDFSAKYDTVKVILQSKKPELVDRLESWNNLYNEELEYFNTINGGKEYND